MHRENAGAGPRQRYIMTKYPKYCKNCRHSRPEEAKGREWHNLCMHPKVVADDPWSVANNDQETLFGVSCKIERSKEGMFAPCGLKGKLWEPRS